MFSLFGAAARDWWRSDPLQLAASLAFYTTFSLAPIVVIALSIVAVIFGEEAATRELIGQANRLIGTAGGQAIEAIIENAERSESGLLASLIGFGTIVVGATAIFAQLQKALNSIWAVEVREERAFLSGLLRDRALGFAIAIGSGFLLVVSLLTSAVLSATRSALNDVMPTVPAVWIVAESIVGFGIITLLFMTIYKVLPDARNRWSDVFVGGLVTAVLFLIGKEAIGLYLGRISVGDAYGAAGSFVVLLIWVYYTALISFFGANFTHVYIVRYGSGVRPQEHAMRAEQVDAARREKILRKEL